MIFLLILFLLVVSIALFIRQRDIVAAAYYSGYRKACKDAVAAIQAEANAEFERGAPHGYIVQALHNASVYGVAVDRVRELAQRIGGNL